MENNPITPSTPKTPTEVFAQGLANHEISFEQFTETLFTLTQFAALSLGSSDASFWNNIQNIMHASHRATLAEIKKQ